MCMQSSQVRPYQRWHWAGDEIAHDTVIRASRKIPGTNNRYEIDIREFLSIEGNAVIRKHLGRLWERLPKDQQVQFVSRDRHAFDFRARKVTEYVGALRYVHSGRRFDDWLFPDETLANGGGDCEDLAFLLAALLEASDISSYCIRVALGAVVDNTVPGRPRRWDHAWVVYQNEVGAWEILEPHALRHQARFKKRKAKARAPLATREIHDVEYIPHFVFNREHLWRVRSPEPFANRLFRDYVKEDRFWKRFEPSFAATVHWSIYDEALIGMPWADLESVKATSLAVDVNVLQYDPRDHFDFAYIDAGWGRVESRLASGTLADFALATHAIADFYAHSFYYDFAKRRPDGSIQPYDPQHPLPQNQLVYDFRPYAPLPGCNSSTPEDASAHWKGKLTSGQWWRWFSTFPEELKNASSFAWRRCLPDHDAVAVDGPDRKAAHRHYTKDEYKAAFRFRRQAAIEHVRAAYRAWRT